LPLQEVGAHAGGGAPRRECFAHEAGEMESSAPLPKAE
jgi:hypothetical protein